MTVRTSTWHVSVRNAPADRTLSDVEWAEVAAAMVDAAGIAPAGDEQACRWVAVRHADDHIHLVATLARVDGRQPRLRGDILAMHAVARAFEARWGRRRCRRRTVRRCAARRRGAGEGRPSRPAGDRRSPPSHRSDRGRARPRRRRLPRPAPRRRSRVERHGDDGTLAGYAVALPGDRADAGSRPVWFSGS
ncbi:mobilization protein, partial [Streptomyces zhihengii]